ncbi:hypothetical protein [Ilumatobacter sp.]|uniref:hypothetical protein n=1 Tax=Ilumatobacter sp. TaxID=1967498 RepID=UPI0037508943
MNFHPLPDHWARQRSLAQRIATHVLGQARCRHDGLFDLVPLPGGFGTPPVGPRRERVRLVGGSLFIERVIGDDVRELNATTQVEMVVGNTIRGLCNAIGFEPDPDFWVGGETPPLGDPDEMIVLDSDTAAVLGEWYLLGQRAIEEAVASIPDAAASVGRLWPEHFDFGIDLAAQPDARVNLGAAAGSGVLDQPYLYVGPWGPERPGPAEYWTAPFGATLTFAELDLVESPLGRAVEFFLHGLSYLRQ